MPLPADAIPTVYSAPASCPSEATFLRQVRSRIHEVHGLATQYDVVLSADGRQVRGILRVHEGDRETVRELAGATCDEVAEGLSLIMALLIDPGANTAPAKDLPPPETPPPAPEPVAKAPPPTPRPVIAEAVVPARPPADGSRPAALLAGLSFFTRSAVAPGLNPAGGPFAEVELGGRGILAPRLRATLELGSARSSLADGSRADFSWVAGLLDACVAVHLIPSRLAMPVCAGLDFGRVVATGSGLADAQTVRQRWISIDGTVRLDWSPSDRTWFLELEGGVQVPLSRSRFYFDPGSTLFTTPRIAGFAGIGVGLRLF